METTTPTTIRAAAHVYNAAYPEAALEIESGTPELDVAVMLASSSGRALRIVATFGIRTADGGFIAAEEPTVYHQARRDGRMARAEIGRRFLAPTARRAGVELRVREVGF